jgi:hypothetical protein
MANRETPLHLLNHRQQAVIRILIYQNDLDIISPLAEYRGEERCHLRCPSTGCDYQAEADHLLHLRCCFPKNLGYLNLTSNFLSI